MKPTDREIAASQPPRTHATPDPGAGLREHVESHRSIGSQAPAPDPQYVYSVYNSTGSYVGPAPDRETAAGRAEALHGFVSLAPIVVDFRKGE